MRATAIVLLSALLTMSPPAAGAEAAAPHVTVTVTVTHDGITAPQAKAIAEALSAARQVYVDHLGFAMPETGPGGAAERG
jgi:hypothetical protein